MARDYTKYTVKGLGENLNKRQLVFEIIKDYVEKNKPSFDELTAIFKDEIQGSKGFIRKAAKVEDPKRFNTKMPLKIKFGVDVVVSNQWGSKNMDAFLSLAKKLKYKITFVEKQSSNSDDFTPSSNLTTEQIAGDGGLLTFEIQVLANDGTPGPLFIIEVESNHDKLADSIGKFNAEVNDDSLCEIVDHFLDEYEDELYEQLMTNSNDPEGNEDSWDIITLEDLKNTENEKLWWDNYPHFAVIKIGETNLLPLYSLYIDDENEIKDGAGLLKVSEDEFEDYASDFRTHTRHSLDLDKFKNIIKNDKGGMDNYICIRVYNEKNENSDFPLTTSMVFKAKEKYLLCFTLSSDGDGVIDGWHFCDLKNKIFGSASFPWGFDEFTDSDEEWIEDYDSLQDLGFDENEIGRELDNMRIEFVEKYLNEKSKDNLLYEAAVPETKISQFKKDNDSFSYGPTLVFEVGNKNSIPDTWNLL